jgi:hypothetical protein
LPAVSFPDGRLPIIHDLFNASLLCEPSMPMNRFLFCLAALSAGVPAADAGPRRSMDQDVARQAAREGARPLRDIQQQWRNGMPGYDYIGSDYDPDQGHYRLKFMREGSVSWVDVDGRTGREVRRSGR